MLGGRSSYPPSRGLAPTKVTLVRTRTYTVAVWRNIMLQHIAGDLDEAFLAASLEGHHATLAFDPTGNGVITIVEPTTSIPSSSFRTQAEKLRIETQKHLRAQAIMIYGEGFFASAMRAIVTGIFAVAKSRVPLVIAASEQEASRFVIDRACVIGTPPEELVEHLFDLRKA